MATLQELLVRSSRTFAVGIEILPEPLRGEITVAYLLLRVSDYLEDSQELGDDEKITLLGDWRDVLGGGGDREALVARLNEAREDTPDALVARNAATVLDGLDRVASDAREILVRRVRESSAGMVRWTDRGSVFETESDLDDYMHEVAGRVGHLLTELFALRLSGLGGERERMMELGREFGLALQTVNVIRGCTRTEIGGGCTCRPLSFPIVASAPTHCSHPRTTRRRWRFWTGWWRRPNAIWPPLAPTCA